MSFWAQRVGVPQAPQQAPAPAPAPAGNRPWWSPAPLQTAPQIVPNQPHQQPGTQASVLPNGTSHIGDLLAQEGYTTEKAQSAKSGERCPSCSSGNYLNIAGLESRAKRCFDCGYNPMFTHSTHGATAVGQSNVAAPVPARVQQMNTNTFDARHIVGHV